MSRRRAGVRAVFAGAVLMSMLGACRVTIDGNADEPYKGDFVQRAEEAGHVEFDLRQPPSRAAVGLKDGDDIAMFDWHDQRKLTTVVLLPGDARFTFDAAHIDVEARDATGLVKEVRMQGSLPDLESARDELRRAAQTFDYPAGTDMRRFTTEAVDGWYEHARQTDPNNAAALGARYYDGRPHGPVRVEIEARRYEDNSVTIYYYFRWDAP